MKKRIVTFGEIMLRLATPDNLRFNQSNQYFFQNDSIFFSKIFTSKFYEDLQDVTMNSPPDDSRYPLLLLLR